VCRRLAAHSEPAAHRRDERAAAGGEHAVEGEQGPPQAEADRDPIRAVILGTGVNSDGRTIGLSLPSEAAQASRGPAIAGDPERNCSLPGGFDRQPDPLVRDESAGDEIELIALVVNEPLRLDAGWHDGGLLSVDAADPRRDCLAARDP